MDAVRSKRLAPWLLAGSLLVVCVGAFMLWLSAELPPGQSGGTWAAQLAVLFVLALSVTLLPSVRSSKAVRPYVASAIAVTALVGWSGHIAYRGLPTPGYLKQAPTAAATREAEMTLNMVADNTCVDGTQDPTSLLPPPYRRCVWKHEVDYLRSAGPVTSGFIFHPHAKLVFDGASSVVVPGTSVPGGPNSCIKHLGGAWWVSTPEGDPAANMHICPTGFHLVEAP